LREVDFGDWTGLSWDEVATRFQVSAFEWLSQLDGAAIPNAECPKAWRGRVEACWNQILKTHAGQEQDLAVICHGGVVRMLLSILLDLPLVKMAAFDVEYASVTCVAHHARKTEVKLLNFVPWRDRL
jgi:broad specificity phosphatase PhoE